MIIVAIFLISPYVLYYFNFRNVTLSESSNDWANFGSYISGVLSPTIMFIGLLISYVFSKNNERTNKTAILRQEMKEKPLLFISYNDFDTSVKISMTNKGIGTLIISDYYFENNVTKEKFPGIFEVFDKPKTEFGYFTSNQKDLILMSGESREVFLIKFEKQEERIEYEEIISEVRLKLKDYTLFVRYTDLYGNIMPVCEKNLKMLGRHIMTINNEPK